MRGTIRSAMLAATVAGGTLFVGGPMAVAAGHNLLAQPSFAGKLAPSVTGCPVAPPVTMGKWAPFASTPGYAATRVTGPPSRSRRSLHVGGAALSACSAYGAYQDLVPNAIPPNAGVTLKAWIYPIEGSQVEQLVYPWVDRSDGGPSFAVEENLTTGSVIAEAWGTSAAISYSLTHDAWHHIELAANATTHTATLRIDGSTVGATPQGYSYPTSEAATMWLGQRFFSDPFPSDFYYDGIVVTTKTG